ncbi:MAG: hypothetical protein HBSAPP03_06450 [Phycisphaerae bacterium]|nr:MAG: hypothetical protein HBSAPP03_06450 [Phycisphaerae bacterium]
MKFAPKSHGPRTLAGVSLLALLAGCGSSVVIRSPGVKVGGSGGASELVFTAAPIQERQDAWAGEPDLSRLDDRLHARAPESAFDQSAWPTAERPGLGRARRLWMGSTSPDQVMYFQRSRDYPPIRTWHRPGGW